MPTIPQATLPALGTTIQSGTTVGIYAGITTSQDGTPYALILLPAKPAKALNWADATAWAASLDAHLPTRPEAALLFANAPGALDKDWHWTSEPCSWNASYAWVCHFDHGGLQYGGHKSFEGSAVAVRRLPLESFSPLTDSSASHTAPQATTTAA